MHSIRSEDYTRVGGTACGGATFLGWALGIVNLKASESTCYSVLGLARALTSARTFEEAMPLPFALSPICFRPAVEALLLAEHGDASKADKLVRSLVFGLCLAGRACYMPTVNREMRCRDSRSVTSTVTTARPHWD